MNPWKFKYRPTMRRLAFRVNLGHGSIFRAVLSSFDRTHKLRKFSTDLVMSRRLSDTAGLKGVTTIRNGVSYSVNLPKFSPPPNANSINIVREDVHEHFRKLTPKQRIAVLTIKDRNLAGKLYVISNVCLLALRFVFQISF